MYIYSCPHSVSAVLKLALEALHTIDQEADALCGLSDAIWDNPELCYQETVSSALQRSFLEERGFHVDSPAFGIPTAFTATFGSGNPKIGILGEFDALSCMSQVADVAEERPLEEGASGHGCGHNLLGTAAVGAALAVKRYLEETGESGTVVYFGCPAEENGSGKAFMAREGAFSDLDCALTWHPGSLNKIYSDSSLANVMTLYHFKGKSAHAAAAPECGRSALDAVELMNIGVNFLREHVVQEARMHYAITNAGGLSPNVVQAKADVLYLVRIPDVEQLGELQERVTRIAQGAALMTETEMSYETIKACANYIPNRELSSQLYRAMLDIPLPAFSEAEKGYAARFTKTLPARPQELDHLAATVGDRAVAKRLRAHAVDAIYDFVVPYDEDAPIHTSFGSTDVGDVSWLCPTAQFVSSTWAPGTPGHTWQVVAQGKGPVAHKMMLWGAKVIALTALRVISDASILRKARAEFHETMTGRTYRQLPDDVKPRAVADLL
jgi:aminobenzoyl-glutamate utilization protein B